MNIKYKEFLRKHTTEDIVNKMEEDAPANAAGSGNIAGIGVGPDGEPGILPSKVMRRKKENEKEQEVITKKISKMVKENFDNNNVILKQILDTIDKVELKIDEKSGISNKVEVIEEKEYKTFKDKYHA